MSKLMFGKLISKLQLSKSPEEREGKRLWSGPTQFDTHRCCVHVCVLNSLMYFSFQSCYQLWLNFMHSHVTS